MRTTSKPFIFKKNKYFDKRGFFQEIFLEKEIKEKIIFTAIAYSKKNVIRGLHFQLKNKQTKIITVISGKILDIAVNLKKALKILERFIIFCLMKGTQFIFQITLLMDMSVYQKMLLLFII